MVPQSTPMLTSKYLWIILLRMPRISCDGNKRCAVTKSGASL